MENFKIMINDLMMASIEFAKFGYKYATLFIFISLSLSMLSWVFSYLYKKFPSNFYKSLEVVSTVAGVMALLINLICSHLIIFSFKTDLVNQYTVIFCICLLGIQLVYLQRGFKISYLFITSVLALPIAFLMFYYLSPVIRAEIPLFNYYGAYGMAIVILENSGGVMWIIKRQTWINRIQLLDRFMPTKNINECILSSVSAFCYSSIILCILQRNFSSSFIEYIILGWISMSLLFNGVISFALLVKYEDAGNQVFPGCLFIYYIQQGYLRCENLISGNTDPSPKFNWKNFFFALLLIISGLGPTAFGVTLEHQ